MFEPWYKKEDSWAIIIGIGIIIAASVAFYFGNYSFFTGMALNIPGWKWGVWQSVLAKLFPGAVILYAIFALLFTVAAKILGFKPGQYWRGFTVLYILSIFVTVLGGNNVVKEWQLETPLLALTIGMLISNIIKLPSWFQTSLRTEFYVKTGIILMGATLPFTIIMQAGPLAILQAAIVTIVTFSAIFFAATRLFGLDPKLGATLGAGGSICGVSAAIAIGGACRAKKEHVSIAISMVVIWAVVMIFLLPLWAKYLGMGPGPAGAWIGNSEFADAAGLAAASAIGDERAVKTFTLMKVVGRDMFVSVWALLVAILSVTVWEKKTAEASGKVEYLDIWRRFPKFIIGFFVASILTTVIITLLGSKSGAVYSKDIIGIIKSIRGWVFTWTFLSIGLTTRFRELTSFGWKPLAAFAIGVVINVPLGYLLSNVVFVEYWLNIK